MDYIKIIKEKKELSGLPDEVVQRSLDKVLLKIKPISKKDKKLIIKEVRAELRKLVGMFKTNKNLMKLVESGSFDEIIKKHKSTKERLSFYPELKKEIYLDNPKSILDIGCGLNPIEIAKPSIKYNAQDIDDNNLKILKVFFKKNKIQNKTYLSDIRTLPTFPKTDVCLIFKVLDIVKMPHKDVEKFISSLKYKKLIVSFPTISLSGRRMEKPKRIWFEKILKNLNLNYKTLKSENEVFYNIEG